MVFNSVGFLIFFPIVLFLYFALPKKVSWVMLLIASYYFYISWNVNLIFLIVFTTVISWVSSMLIERSQNKAIRKLFLVITLVTCLGILFFYKYFNSVKSLKRKPDSKCKIIAFCQIIPFRDHNLVAEFRCKIICSFTSTLVNGDCSVAVFKSYHTVAWDGIAA